MAGTIKVRTSTSGDTTTVKTLVKHPMQIESRDKKTGKRVEAHFIQRITFSHNGEAVVTADCGQAVSKNPYFAFKLKKVKDGDTLTIAWVDNRGEKDSLDVQLA